MGTPDTKGRLVDAAERVFARDGFAGASLREIMRDAGANAAAVHYHYGGKDGLLKAVLDRVVNPITQRRFEGLEALRAASVGQSLPVRGLVEAFLRPDFEAIARLRARGPGRARLVGHAYGQADDTVRTLMGRQFDPIAAAYFPEFFRSLPHIEPDELRWRLRWGVVGVIVNLFSNADEDGGPVDPSDMEASLRRAVDFLTAGLAADTS